MRTNRLIGFGILAAIVWIIWKQPFATATRVSFPGFDQTPSQYWTLSPNGQYWIGQQGDRAPVNRMPADGLLLPPPPVPLAPEAGQFHQKGFLP